MADFERLLEALEGRYFGKYRGEVVDNNDPAKEGRVLVKVAGVMGKEPLWAMPCSPYAGADVGFFALPPVGARVWVEFEGGHPDHPIWSGCYWLPGQLAAADAVPNVMFLKTPGATIRIEATGTVEIETVGGTKLTLSGSEITLEAPSIKHSANGGATELNATGFDAMNGALKVV